MLERVLFIRVTLPPFDRYNRFQLANCLSILPTTSSQQDLALKGAPNGRPRYFIGREETPQPKMLAKPSILSTSPTGTKGRILTFDNLRKRKVIVIEWCCMCTRSRESTYHLLLHCEVARVLWTSIFRLFGV